MGCSKGQVWRHIHLGIDEVTLEFRAVEVTTSNAGDAPKVPDLPDQIESDQKIATAPSWAMIAL